MTDTGGNTTGQILGASTALVLGVSTLPNTGGTPLTEMLSIMAITAGTIVLTSFILTRILKKIL